MARRAPVKAKGWSIPATTQRVLELLDGLDWPRARVADVGAGRGHFSMVLGERLRAERGLEPRAHVFACDPIPASFEYEGIACQKTAEDGRLPFETESFDAVVAIEVIEHVEDQFAFLRELARIAKPEARVIVTTPNVLHAGSRLRTFACGFPSLFDPLPLQTRDPRLLGGHIHPISPYYLAYAALRAGLETPELHGDRTKSSAAGLAIAASPIFFTGRAWHTLRLRRKHPGIFSENRAMLAAQHGWRMLTSRTAVLLARKRGAR